MVRIGVLGAGPAAGAAALELARAGAEVTVIRPERPGEKPCGGAFPSYVLEELPGFDATRVEAIAAPVAVLENAAGGRVELELPGLRIVRRGEFDPALIEAARAAGAGLVAGKARQLEWRDGRPRVEVSGEPYEFDWLIGGDGARGLSRRTLGLEPRGESVGLGASLTGVEAGRLVLAFPDLADAYLWLFPRPGGCSVGIAYTVGEASDGAAGATLARFVERHLGRRLEELEGARYRYPIPVFGSTTAEAVAKGVARRILLVGDAAAVADPLTREGIRYAIWSGRAAAEALVAGEPETYGERLLGRIEADLERALRARELFFEDPIGQWMVPFCRLHPGVRRLLTELLACRQPYVGLRGRLLRSSFGLSAGR